MICFQETYLKEPCRFFVRGYDIFQHDRPTGHKGVVITLVKHNILAVLIAQSAGNDLEFITIKVFLQGEELFITNIYSPPTSRLDLPSIDLLPEKHLTVGDFSSHSPAWGYNDSNPRGDEIQDWLTMSLSLSNNQLTSHPTTPEPGRRHPPPTLRWPQGMYRSVPSEVVDQLGGSDHVLVYQKPAHGSESQFRTYGQAQRIEGRFIKAKTSELQQSWRKRPPCTALKAAQKNGHLTKPLNKDVRRRRGVIVKLEWNMYTQKRLQETETPLSSNS